MCLLFLLHIGFGWTATSAQPTMAKPYRYGLPTRKMQTRDGLGRNQPGDLNPAFVWSVYSDRDHNPTYTEPDSTLPEMERLSFAQQLYVLEEGGSDGDYIHVVYDPGLDGFDLSGHQKDYGWIHKSKVLLWSHCMVGEVSRIDIKALGALSIGGLSEVLQDGAAVACRTGPGTKFGVACPFPGKEPFVFVYKSADAGVDTYALLGRSPTMGEGQVGGSMIGWVLQSELVLWGTRLALEPNWGPEACEERRVGRKARLFMDSQSARAYRDSEDPDSRYILWEADALGARPVGEWSRFPALEWSEEGFIEAAVVGRLEDGIRWDGEQDRVRIFGKAVEDVLALAGVGEAESVMARMPDTRIPFCIRGYAPEYVRGQAEPLFRPVLLMDRTEVYRALTRLADLTRATSGSSAREQLKQTWIQVLRAYLGDIDPLKLENMKIEEANELVWGISFVSPLLEGIRLREIPKLPPERFGQIVRLLKERYDTLARIYQMDKYDYSFRSNGRVYYWLSTDVIP